MGRRWHWWWRVSLGLWSLLTVFVGAARALGPIDHMPLVQIALWPEYDRGDMLVMYIVHLPQDVRLPTEVALRIPARVEAPSAVAVRTPEGRLLNTEYRVEADPTSPAWRMVVATATEPILHIEYYDPALQVDGAQRSFSYVWPGDWTVDNLTVEVQHPRTAVALEISPEPTRVETRDDTLRYYVLEFGAVAQGETVQVDLTYQNPTGEWTAPPQLPPEDILPTAAAPNEPTSTVLWWPWVLASLGLVLLLAALGLYWRSSRGPAPETVGTGRTRRRKGKPRAQPRPVAPGEVRYCPQCGTRARPGDRYCRMCGTPLH